MNYKTKFGKPVKSILQLQDAFFICIGLLFVLFYNNSFAQSGLNEFSVKEKKIFSSQYSLKHLAADDSLRKSDSLDKPFKMTKSPLKAVLYSAAFPGLGQLYNKSYWKIPVIWAFGGYFIYEIVVNNNRYIDYRDDYAKSQTAQNPNGDQRLKALREFYRDQRDQFYVYAGLVYLINIFDAFVDAHLFDFDVSDRMRVGVFKNTKNLMNLKINF